ncbi:MAG: lysophospholipid acyltransferase family protein [Candidatus Melainabacteria bacterium]
MNALSNLLRLTRIRLNPNAHRFWAPRLRPAYRGWFHQLNRYFLGKYRCREIRISPADERKLLAAFENGGPGMMLVCNHVGYVDAHVLCDWLFRRNRQMYWMAGVEPFERAWGAYAWHISSMGAFSIDRGRGDYRALKQARDILAEGRHPLLIFPEGEADYAMDFIRPFYDGAALLALKTHDELTADQRAGICIVPMALRYALETADEQPTRLALRLMMAKAAALYRTLPPVLPVDEPLSAQLRSALATCVAWLTEDVQTDLLSRPAVAGSVLIDPQAGLADRILQLADAMTLALSREYGQPPVQLSALGYAEAMQVKNKLRSVIARQVLVPRLSDLTALRDTLPPLARTEKPSAWQRWWLGELELGIAGVKNTERDWPERVEAMTALLDELTPLAARRAAQPETERAWRFDHLNRTRQIKHLLLLWEDVTHWREDLGWLDDVLTRLEIMMTGTFHYRGPKSATVLIGESLSVDAFNAGSGERSLKKRCQLLTRRLHQTVTHLGGLTPVNDRLIPQPQTENGNADPTELTVQ